MHDSNKRFLTTGTVAAALIAVLLPTGCMNPTRPVIVPPAPGTTPQVELPQPPGVG
jgi:hypothetical protein